MAQTPPYRDTWDGRGSVYASLSSSFFSYTHLPIPASFLLVLPGGRPPLKATSSATVFVNLLDLNDNDPTFQNLPFVAEVLEGTPAGVSVYQVSVTHSPSPCVCSMPSIFIKARYTNQDLQQYVSQAAWGHWC